MNDNRQDALIRGVKKSLTEHLILVIYTHLTLYHPKTYEALPSSGMYIYISILAYDS